MYEKIKRFFTHILANHSVLFFACIVVIIVLIGTTAFYFIEWRDIFNSFYFTSATMSTIWYGDMAPITHAGKTLSIIYGFMGAPLFIWLTWLFFQSRFQSLVKNSIHNYHKEIKEAEKLSKEFEKENKLQKEKIEEIKEDLGPVKKKRRKFW